MPKHKMNRLEKRYSHILESRKQAGEIIDWLYEPMGLRLAPKTFYHFDFFVVTNEGFQVHETKGFLRDDAMVKLKVAADKFPWFQFYLVRYLKKQWVIKLI